MTNNNILAKEREEARVLMIGDVVGKPGRDVVVQRLGDIRTRYQVDFVIANVENAAGGSGVTPEIYNALLNAGIDCATLGDHAFRQKSFIPVYRSSDRRVVRPANLQPDAPGKGWTVLEIPATESRAAVKIGVAALLGRYFMPTPGDSLLPAVDKILERFADVKVRFIDLHAEATSEKQLVARYLDGKVTAALGTHTHVATADERVLPNGTAFQCDVGMTGPFESVIGRKIDSVLEHYRTGCPVSFEVANGFARLNGTLVDVDPSSGKATRVQRLDFGIED